MQNYEERLRLLETEEAIRSLMDSNKHLTFQTQLQGVQLTQVKEKISKTEDITDEEALKLVLEDEDALKIICIIPLPSASSGCRSPKMQIFWILCIRKAKRKR